MAAPVRIDSHVHIYQSAEEGIAAKEGYEIWEYGRQDEVTFSDVPGTVDDLLRSMEKSSMDKVVIVNLYVCRRAAADPPKKPSPRIRDRANGSGPSGISKPACVKSCWRSIAGPATWPAITP